MVLLFEGIAPPSQFPATIASGAPPRPNHACFQGRVDVCSETRWRSKGGRGGACLHRAHYAFPKKKKALSANYVPTTSARTSVAHRVHERVACPLWGAPPRGPKTWVMEVVERTEVKKGGLRALVQGTIKVVLIIARLIACRTRSFPSGPEKSV